MIRKTTTLYFVYQILMKQSRCNTAFPVLKKSLLHFQIYFQASADLYFLRQGEVPIYIFFQYLLHDSNRQWMP